MLYESMFYENKEDLFYCAQEQTIEYPLHIHQYIEIVHVVQGQIDMQIGPEKYSICSGEIGIIFPNVAHDYHTVTSADYTKFRITNCYPDILPFYKKQLLCTTPQNPVLSPAQIHEDVLYAEERLLYLDYKEDTIPLANALISLMMARVFPIFRLADHQSETPQDISCEIIAYLGNHFRENVTLTSVASKFGIGKFTLSRIFSNTLRVNFTHYINSLRVNYAQHLLTTTDIKILNIAIECGYQNQQTFNRVFKEICGSTPKEYRRANYQSIVLPPTC